MGTHSTTYGPGVEAAKKNFFLTRQKSYMLIPKKNIRGKSARRISPTHVSLELGHRDLAVLAKKNIFFF
jgi:hypothetical protein